MAGSFNEVRFHDAVSIACVTKREIAEAVGVSPARLSQFKVKPPNAELADKLAAFLGVLPEFFFADLLPEATDPFFRRLSKTPAAIRDAYRHTAKLLGAAMLEAGAPTSERALPDLADLPPAAAAAQFRCDLGLQPDEPVGSVLTFMETHGAWVHELSIDDDDRVDAFCTTVAGTPLVFLNPTRADPYRTRQNAGHEWCHLTRHEAPEVEREAKKQQEDEANEFAGEFLLSARVWRDLAPRRGLTNPWSYLEAKGAFGISVKALLRKTRAANLITEGEYTYALMRYSTLGWHSGEPAPDSNATDVHERPTLGRRLITSFGSLPALAEALLITPDLARRILGLDEGHRRPILRIVEDEPA